jgi:hypothetical protein
MLVLLTIFSFSAVLELNSENVANVIGSNLFSFVSFESVDSPFLLTDEFLAASDALPRVGFARVNCSDQNSLCVTYNITSLPVVNFYFPTRTNPVPFNGTHSFDGYCDFLMNLTHYQPIRPFNPQRFLTYDNYDETVRNSSCLFVTYYYPSCERWKLFQPAVRGAAIIFLAEPNVTVAAVQCSQYSEICDRSSIHKFTTLLQKEGKVVEYSGPDTSEGIRLLINEHCGTERGEDGLLLDSAGIDQEGRDIVKEFLESPNKEAVISKIKGRKGFEYYGLVMERYMKGGLFSVQKQAADLLMHIEATKGRVSWTVTDTLKKTYNVLLLFGVREATQNPSTDL